MRIPHIVWKSLMKGKDGHEVRYLVWAESVLGAAQQVQSLRKEQGLELHGAYNVCRLSDKGDGPIEMDVDLSSYSILDATNDVFENMFRNPVMVCL